MGIESRYVLSIFASIILFAAPLVSNSSLAQLETSSSSVILKIAEVNLSELESLESQLTPEILDKLRSKMEAVDAVGIFITHDKQKPPGVKPFWKDLKAVYETRFEDEKTFVTEPLPAKKGKGYKKGKHKKNLSC